MRHYWSHLYRKTGFSLALTKPDSDRVHIVIEVRSINHQKINNHSSARYIKNLNDLIQQLESIPNVRVTAQDFAKLSFEKQFELAHTAGVFLSMHGAGNVCLMHHSTRHCYRNIVCLGTTHIFHAALGEPNCCALVELFPDRTIEFYAAYGYGNLARMFGFHHYRYEATMGRTTSDGTEVDVNEIRELTTQAVNAVRTKPTCLHDNKDTTKPIYSRSLFD